MNTNIYALFLRRTGRIEYNDQAKKMISKRVDEHVKLIRPKFLNNHTYESKTDLDASINVKCLKAGQLNFLP